MVLSGKERNERDSFNDLNKCSSGTENGPGKKDAPVNWVRAGKIVRVNRPVKRSPASRVKCNDFDGDVQKWVIRNVAFAASSVL